MILGLDIGGANVKYAILSDKVESGTIHLPLWRRENCERLSEVLSGICEPNVVCTVTTAEICDTFKTKEEGVSFIEKAVKKAFPSARHFFLNCRGELKEEAKPEIEFAASNWVASVTVLEGDFIFADMGTTTTDLIPVRGRILSARSDFERLRRGELLYVGMLRTPVFHVLRYSRVLKAPPVPELYANVGDALILTGDIGEKDYICETFDGRGKTPEECMQRIARQFCCDADELPELAEVAREVREAVVSMLAEAIEWQAVKWRLKKVVACGKGDFLLEEAAKMKNLECEVLREKFGELSDVFPAYACAILCERECLS